MLTCLFWLSLIVFMFINSMLCLDFFFFSLKFLCSSHRIFFLEPVNVFMSNTNKLSVNLAVIHKCGYTVEPSFQVDPLDRPQNKNVTVNVSLQLITICGMVARPYCEKPLQNCRYIPQDRGRNTFFSPEWSSSTHPWYQIVNQVQNQLILEIISK